jgi:hypothetical protein
MKGGEERVIGYRNFSAAEITWHLTKYEDYYKIRDDKYYKGTTLADFQVFDRME